MVCLEGTDKEVCHRGTTYVLQSLMKNKKEVLVNLLRGYREYTERESQK